MNNDTVIATALKCEYLHQPLGIDVQMPRLSWEIRSSERGQRQTAWHILAASTEELLAAGTGDLWDSGKIDSSQSIHVPYGGTWLRSGMRCFWKVRVWDVHGNPGPYSDSSWWEMGLLDQSEWQANWIAPPATATPGDRPPGPAPLFRRTIIVDESVVSARAYICGLGLHELHINGSKIGDHVLDPKPTRYDRRALCVTHDITPHLTRGENAVGVMLGTGLYDAHTQDVWNSHTAPWRDRPKLLAQIHLTKRDGSVQIIASDSTWKTSIGPVVFDGLRNGETYDARLEKPGWSSPGFDESGWAQAMVIAGPGGRVSAQNSPPCRTMQTIEPVSVSQVGPETFVFDMGQNFAGWAQLTVTGPAGTEVVLRYGESLDESGRVDQKHIASLTITGEFQTDRYILKGEVTEVWEPRFTYHGFRYVQVEGFPGVPTRANLRGRVVHTAFDSAGRFECSNELLNAIQRCTRWSYLSNFVGIPTDCPHREKNGWTGDALIAAETGLFNFASQSAYAAWMTDFTDEQRESGQLPGIIPTGGWGYNWGSGPAWDSALTHIPWYLYQYSGDERILGTLYPNMKRYVDFMTSMATGNIVSFGLGDWCPPGSTPDGCATPTALTSTGYYYANCRILAHAARLTGNDHDAEHYSALAVQIKSAFISRFYDPSTGMYADGGQASQACALFHGLVEAEEKPKVLARLIESIEENDRHPDFGILGAKYVLNALTDEGRPDVALDILSQTTYPSWGHWIEQGATTLWETWEGNASRNHIMFGDVSAWMFKTLAGIIPDPEHSGFRRFIIRPHVLGELTWVKAEHRCMYGPIRSSWRLEGTQCEYEMEIPANTEAQICLRSDDASLVMEGGRPVSECAGIASVRHEQGYVIVSAGSGRYHFCAPGPAYTSGP